MCWERYNGDRKAAQADWNSAAGLAGELSTGFGGMDLDDQEDQQQQQLQQIRAEQAKKKVKSASHNGFRARARKLVVGSYG